MNNDIFVSYARDDDVVPADLPPSKGFVSFLCNQLVYEFTRLGPRRPRLWRDIERVEKGDDFAERFEEQLGASSLLLIILSRNWMASSWCARELELFARKWGRNGDAARRHIVFAAKHFIDLGSRPALIQGQEGFNFFSLDADAGDVIGNEREFLDRGAVRDQRYYERVGELARYLYRAANQFEDAQADAVQAAGADEVVRTPSGTGTGGRSTGPGGGSTQCSVYVAQPAADMRSCYDRVVAEIRGRGYRVVPDPDVEIPKDESAVDFLDSALQQADMSVHLIGQKLGYAPEDAAPIVKLQLARAAAHLEAGRNGPRHRKFFRLIWVAPLGAIAESSDSCGRDPLEVLSTTDRQLDTDKVEGGSLSKFVDFLLQCVDRAALSESEPVSELLDAETIVYINHRIEDTEQAIQLGKALAQRQLDIRWPYFDGDPGELRAMHRENLRDADLVLLCWAKAPDVWISKAAQELRNWRELGRTKRFACRLLVAAPPPAMSKKRLLSVPPRSDIDDVLDLTACEQISADSIDAIVRVTRSREL